MKAENLDINALRKSLQGQTVVSIQPVAGSPLENTAFIAAMAQAAEQAGAKALRIEGVENVEAVSQVVNVPIIGIVKRDLIDSPIRITPFVCDVDSLANAGATIIAFDATNRPRPESREIIADAIRHSGCFSMADCSNFEDGEWAHSQGIDIIGTTLSGYVGGSIPDEPDLPLVKQFSDAGFLPWQKADTTRRSLQPKPLLTAQLRLQWAPLLPGWKWLLNGLITQHRQRECGNVYLGYRYWRHKNRHRFCQQWKLNEAPPVPDTKGANR